MFLPDFKVDVHRKNSSESSDSADGLYPNIANKNTITTYNAEISSTSNHRKNDSNGGATATINNNNENNSSSNSNNIKTENNNELKDVHQTSNEKDMQSKSHNHDTNDEVFMSIKYVDKNRHESYDKDESSNLKSTHYKLKRQISLDSEKVPIDRASMMSKLQRHRSTEGHDDRHTDHQKNLSNVSLILPPHSSHTHHHLSGGHHHNHSRMQSLASDLYLENNYTTKSELAIENIPNIDHHLSNKHFAIPKSTPMRRDSNSTMSAIQLPITAGPSSFLPPSRNRRHSNATNNIIAVRRIKSAALETCQQQPSTSNLGPHPNSVEAIAGQIIRNPQTTLFPMPSKTLSRNPHLNLFPKSGHGSFLISTNNLTSNVDPVYPIAEQADESGYGCVSGLSLSDEFSSNQNSESDDGDDEDSRGMHSHQRQSITESESDLDRLPLQSTDSDTENNGSRSPLLEVRNRVPLFLVDKSSSGLGAGGSGTNEKKNDKNDSSLKLSNKSKLKKMVKNSGGNKDDEDSEDVASSDGEEASGGSKDMLLIEKDAPDYVINFNVFRENNFENAFVVNADGTPADMPPPIPIRNVNQIDDIPPAIPIRNSNHRADIAPPIPTRNSGAIPKSRARLGASSRRFSAEEHCRTEQSVGQSHQFCSTNLYETIYPHNNGASTTKPISLYSLFKHSNVYLNAMSENDEHNIIVVSTKGLSPTVPFRPRCRRLPNKTNYAVIEPNRHRQPKIRRSTRQKHRQQTKLSDNADLSSKDDPDTTHSHPECATNSHRYLDDSNKRIVTSGPVYGYDIIPADRLPVQTTIISSISRVDFNENSYPDFGRHFNTEKPPQAKRYYKFPFDFLGSKKQIKIAMDRLQLLALFDRDFGWFQVHLAIILAIFVAILGSLVLQKQFYADIYAFIFCFVIAGSQYSLLKSVQPDAASPIHGFNKTVSYSRPIYFCICSSLLLLSHRFATESLPNDTSSSSTLLTIFGFPFHQHEFFSSLQYILSIILLAFPIFFSLGLFPQINTFLMYLLEQIDMHIFGGNAVCSLGSAFISVIRSVFACFILYGPAFGGLSELKQTQNVLFSFFCALIISISYHLSRSASDFTCIWNLIKSSIIFHPDEDIEGTPTVIYSRSLSKQQELSSNLNEDNSPNNSKSNLGSGDILPEGDKKSKESIESQHTPLASTSAPQYPTSSTPIHQNNDETELLDPLPKKLQSTVNNRLKNDLLICTFLGILVMALHSSTIFTVLQPDLNIVLYAIAIIVGILLHYIIPQMRKHLPWLCIARPILRQQEYGQFEASDASHVMWFECTYIILSFFEKNILYPLIFLSTLTADSGKITKKYGNHFGTALVIIAGLKCKLHIIN